MSSTAIATVTKMMESLPEPAQDQVVEHLREYLEDLQDELQWDALFRKTQPQLVAAARQAGNRSRSRQTDGLRPAMKSATLPSFWSAYARLYERFFS